MAITPRMILTQPAPAAVLSVALFGLTVMGTHAADRVDARRVEAAKNPCELTGSVGQKEAWTEGQWVGYASCLEDAGHWDDAIVAAHEGRAFYPRSEALHSIEAYNLLQLDRPIPAADVLEQGLEVVGRSRSGVMENNLAWAYLGHPDASADRLSKARTLYRVSLHSAPHMCEAIHTGMMVEFQIARTETGIERAESLKNYTILRGRYRSCENRDRSWGATVETTGAAVMDAEIETMLGSEHENTETIRQLARTVRGTYGPRVTPVLCEEALPLADLRDECATMLASSMRDLPAPTVLAEPPADYQKRNDGWLNHYRDRYEHARTRQMTSQMNAIVTQARYRIPDLRHETHRWADHHAIDRSSQHFAPYVR